MSELFGWIVGLYGFLRGLLDNDIQPSELLNARIYTCFHRGPYSYIAQQTQTPLMPALHLLHTVLHRPAHSCHVIAMAQGSFDKRSSYVACRAEDEPCLLCRRIRL